jgi:hypothetical protein
VSSRFATAISTDAKLNALAMCVFQTSIDINWR